MTARAVIVDSGGRAKVYRPLPESGRAAAIAAGVAAYEQGDFFAAHEHMEPAWMGTDDPGERAYVQGLIKLAAAYVHAVRGNPAGMAKNLKGARRWLVEAAAAVPPVRIPGATQIDLAELINEIDLRLADLAANPSSAVHAATAVYRAQAAHPSTAALGPPVLRRSAS